MGSITENVKKILAELPSGVTLVAAAKTRTAAEVREAFEAGVAVMGENYLQDARAVMPEVSDKIVWHFIGHVQKNKVKHVVKLFDMIETVDSLDLAEIIDSQARKLDKVMPVLVEVNSGRETQKNGVMPEDVEALIRRLAAFANIRVCGLMTMGPWVDDPEELRPCFRETRELFDRIADLALPGVEMRQLSMGMSESFRVAVEEGATLVRIGTAIFGPRT